MIRIICVGKIKEKFLNDMVLEYEKRINKYTKLEISEIMEEKIDDTEIALQKEGEKILMKISAKDFVIIADREGREVDSIEFAEKIRTTQIRNSHITFIIGSSHGLCKAVKMRADFSLSFSKMTFPHQLFRGLLLEQIYRAYKIINNERYHK